RHAAATSHVRAEPLFASPVAVVACRDVMAVARAAAVNAHCGDHCARGVFASIWPDKPGSPSESLGSWPLRFNSRFDSACISSEADIVCGWLAIRCAADIETRGRGRGNSGSAGVANEL